MSWRDDLTDEQRTGMSLIQASLSHTRVASSGARFFRVEDGKVVEKKRPSAVAAHSMFPYHSSSMAVDPSDVPVVKELLRVKAKDPAKFTEFDRNGRPIITSTKQHAALAEAFEMKTGRDGFGHKDEHGNFQNSGRRRNDEIQEGRARIRKAQEKLMAMPETMPTQAVQAVLNEYDIGPTEENTG